MFKKGQTYEVVLDDGEDRTTYYGLEVIQVDMPLIKVRSGNGEMILNTTSRSFVSAKVLA